MVAQAQQIQADRLEKELDNMNNPVARIFRLKKLRPEYRDNYRATVVSDSMEKLLTKLTEIGQKVLEARQEPPIEAEYKLIPEETKTDG